MSYEAEMLQDLAMPSRKKVEEALLKTLFKPRFSIRKEFCSSFAAWRT